MFLEVDCCICLRSLHSHGFTLNMKSKILKIASENVRLIFMNFLPFHIYMTIFFTALILLNPLCLKLISTAMICMPSYLVDSITRATHARSRHSCNLSKRGIHRSINPITLIYCILACCSIGIKSISPKNLSACVI